MIIRTKEEQYIKELHDKWEERTQFAGRNSFMDLLCRTIASADKYNLKQLYFGFPYQVDEFCAYAHGMRAKEYLKSYGIGKLNEETEE